MSRVVSEQGEKSCRGTLDRIHKGLTEVEIVLGGILGPQIEECTDVKAIEAPGSLKELGAGLCSADRRVQGIAVLLRELAAGL